MKLLGRKFTNRYFAKQSRIKTETRDAILWDIDEDNHFCHVKLQGSNELVKANFPQNEARLMSFMRKGNAVRVAHRGGVRGYLEVTGHGMAIPTPVYGESHPGLSDLADGIVSGCQVIPTEPASMSVVITDGTFRLNGELYSLSEGSFGFETMDETSEVTMSEAYPPMVMGETEDYETMSETSEITMDEVFPPMTMGDPIGEYPLDAAPGGNQFRYDCFYVDEDCVIHYLKGSAVGSNPAKPSIPANTVLLGEYILLWTGVTEITGQHIGMEWEEPYPSTVTISAIDEFPWNGSNPNPETNVTVAVKNQYEWGINGNYEITLSMILGSGWLWSATSGYDEDSVTQIISNDYDYVFKYKRDEWTELGDLIIYTNETSPYLMVNVTDNESLYLHAFHRITLLSEGGTEIVGTQVHTQKQIVIPSGGAASVDWDNGHFAEMIIDQDTTLSFSITPSTLDLDKLILLIEQDDTGGWTPTLPSSVKFGEEITDVIVDETANKRSYLGFIYHPGSSSYDLVANVSGYPKT